MNKLNPLLEAITNIDDDLVSSAVKAKSKRSKSVKAIAIAAAAAAVCTVTTVTAMGALKPPKEVVVNDDPVQFKYKTYPDENGRMIAMYAIDVPDYALNKEEKGKTPVGEFRAVPNPEYPNRWGKWMIVDEAGNEFHTSINNKLVFVKYMDSVERIGFDCSNLNGDYTYLEFEENCDYDAKDFRRNNIYIVTREKANELLRERGINVDDDGYMITD